MFKKTPTPNTTEAATNTEAATVGNAASVAFDELQAASMLSIHRATMHSVFALRSEIDFLKLFNAHVVRSFVGAQRLLSRVNFELEKSSVFALGAADALRKAEYGTAALDFETDACQPENGDPLPVFDTCSTQGQPGPALMRFLKLSLTRARCLAAIADLRPLYFYLAQPAASTGDDAEFYHESFQEWLSDCPLLEITYALMRREFMRGETISEQELFKLFSHWVGEASDDSLRELQLEQQFEMFQAATEKQFQWRRQADGTRLDDCVYGMLQSIQRDCRSLRLSRSG